MCSRHYIAVIILFLPTLSFSHEVENVCPLTKSYILENLHSIKELIDSNSYKYPSNLHSHILRMSGDVLKIDEFAELKKEVLSDRKSCSFYWIGAAMNGIEGNYSQEAKSTMLNELELNVDKCISWVSAHHFANENNIKSVFCK